jgi:hypothetical protein
MEVLMFGSNILEVAIGIVFVYLLLSLLCTTINEQVITRILALRARTLEDGIKNMLAHPQMGDALVQQVYDNPLIKGLSQNAASNKPRKPSYIPADLFAVAVMGSNLVQSYKNNPDAVDSNMPAALALIIQKANNDAVKELAGIEKWFNDTMERVSGWYKRRVQLIIFLLGLVIIVGLNVDTISLITNLSNNTVIRSTIVAAAQGPAATQANANLPTLVNDIKQIQPVIGWSSSTLPADIWGWILKIVGLLATTFAVSLGAPFWFDVLNKFIAFRASGPPPQPSPGSAGPTIPTTKLVVEAAPSPNNIIPPVANSSNNDAQSSASSGGSI